MWHNHLFYSPFHQWFQWSTGTISNKQEWLWSLLSCSLCNTFSSTFSPATDKNVLGRSGQENPIFILAMFAGECPIHSGLERERDEKHSPCEHFAVQRPCEINSFWSVTSTKQIISSILLQAVVSFFMLDSDQIPLFQFAFIFLSCIDFCWDWETDSQIVPCSGASGKEREDFSK